MENEEIGNIQSPDVGAAVDIASHAGKILLESGADITRVEDTINHIMFSFGITKYDIYTLTNGIFLSASGTGAAVIQGDRPLPEGMSASYLRIYNVPRSSTKLDRVDAVNTLSRGIEAGKYNAEQAKARLEEIEKLPARHVVLRLVAAGVSSGALCYIFGGSLTDSLVSALIGFLYYIAAIQLDKTKLSKLLTNAFCGALLAVLTIISIKIGIGSSMDKIIIGAIMPLIPGVSFVNAVRDIAAGDYISGSVRMIDAAVIAFGIATGVGAVLAVVSNFGLL